MKQSVISKTEQSIINGFIKCLQSTSFSRIFVSDICQAARVSRSTFYVYFNDKYDLLTSMFMYLRKCHEQEGSHLPSISVPDKIRNSLVFLAANKDILHHLMDDSPDSTVVRIFKEHYSEQMDEHLNQVRLKPTLQDIPRAAIISYFYGGIVQLIIDWIHQEFRTSVDQQTDIQTKLYYTLVDVSDGSRR